MKKIKIILLSFFLMCLNIRASENPIEDELERSSDEDSCLTFQTKKLEKLKKLLKNPNCEIDSNGVERVAITDRMMHGDKSKK